MAHNNLEFFFEETGSINEEILLEPFSISGYSLFLKREDQIHSEVSGNKFRKLKYLFEDMRATHKRAILTFGGAFSNHIAATASAGKLFSIPTVGVIRGEELEPYIESNPTLQYASRCGMRLIFMSRSDYKDKDQGEVLKRYIRDLHDYYIIPEGGTSQLAVKGCSEILSDTDVEFDHVAVAVGTGGTFAGILNSLQPHQEGIGFSVLNGTFQKEILDKFSSNSKYQLTDRYNFGGYAKIDSELVRFINKFKELTNIQLDPVYTAKMMYGIMNLMKAGYFRKNSRILAIHTGGLQGINGMNLRLKSKNLPQIEI